MRISPTKLSTFRDCKTSYAARYVYNLQPKVESTYSILGSATHAGIEAGYKNKYPYTAFDNVVDSRFNEIEGKPLLPYTYSRKELTILGYSFLDNFDYDRLEPQHMEYRFDIPEEEYTLTGIIDFIGTSKDTQGTGILDFKTSSKPMSQTEVNNSLQLAMYYTAYMRIFEEEPAFLGIYHIPSSTITYVEHIAYALGEVDRLISELLEYIPPPKEDLVKCSKCSIFCPMKWS